MKCPKCNQIDSHHKDCPLVGMDEAFDTPSPQWSIDPMNNRQILDSNGEPRISILANTPEDWPQCALLAARVVEVMNQEMVKI